MLASAVSPHPDLVTLIALLNQLLGQTEAGDWEAVTAIQPEVCQRLADLQRHYDVPAAARNSLPADRDRLVEIAALVKKAEVACTTRRDQIAPLVNSLKALPDPIKA